MKNTMTKNITIRDIIYSRIDFIENNNIFDKKEYMYVNKGEIEAYSEILTDIELLTIDAFVEKYLCILKKVSEKLDNEHNLVQKFLNKWTIFLFCSILFSSNQKEH